MTSHVTTFMTSYKHLSGSLELNNSLEQCAVMLTNRLLLEGSMNSTPVKGVLNQRFKTPILPSQNKHERSP